MNLVILLVMVTKENEELREKTGQKENREMRVKLESQGKRVISAILGKLERQELLAKRAK